MLKEESINNSFLINKSENNIFLPSIETSENINEQSETNKLSSIDAENKRFTEHSPLVTLLIMSIGPLSNLIAVLFETLNMYLISKKFNQNEDSHAVEIIGFSSQFQNLFSLIGNFFGQCFLTRISSLIGSGDRERAAYLCSDIFKLAFIISILYGILLFFIVKPFLHFVGTPETIFKKAYEFNIFQLIFIPFQNMFTLEFCFFQSIGNSILLGIIVVISKFVQSAILAPFILFICKVSPTYMKLANDIVELIVSISILILVYLQKFSLKPNVSMLFSFKLSQDTLNSLIYPIPYIIAFIGSCFAPMLILNCMTSCIDENEQLKQAIGSVFAVFGQINSINQALPSSIVLAFLATGNHAFGSKNMKRLKKLLFWALLITIISGLIFSFSVVVFKNQISNWFIKNEFELKLSSKMLPIPFYTSFLYGIGLCIYSLILIVKKPICDDFSCFQLF